MRDVLEALAAGELSVAEAEARLAGYATTEAGRFDAAREGRRGVPEAVLGEGKTPDEVADLARAALESTGRALVTRATPEARTAVRETVPPSAAVEERERAGLITVHAGEYEPPALDADVAVVAAGTSDAAVAEEAAAVAAEMGARVERYDDVGVAGVHRLLDVVEPVRAADVVVVAAGREGALPTVVAGLVDTPVIGLPVGTGYGHGGAGEAALLGMLQSCTVLSVVNVDAGFVAGAQAGLVARTVSEARSAAGTDE
ncbi:MAG: nickel pincer cofactor biosynthesis protein LarB [Halobacteriales archaeon]